jgi:hypothetical protein
MCVKKKNKIITLAYAIKIHVLILICLSLSVSRAFADSSLILIATQCNGKLLEISPGSPYKELGKINPVGTAQCSYLYEDIYFSSNSDSIDLIDTKSLQSIKSIRIKEQLDNNYHLWKICYVDATSVFFSAYLYDTSKPINKQSKSAFIYEVNIRNGEVLKLPITNCRDTTFSKFNDKIYYTGNNTEIYEYSSGVSKKVGARGWGVSISPQGDKLAYIISGLIKERVEILNLTSGKTTTMLKKGWFWPIIRWSDDGKHIAVNPRSDISAQPLFVINVSSHSVEYKFENTYACNWNFVEP